MHWYYTEFSEKFPNRNFPAVITLPFPPFSSQKNYIGGILSKIGLETSAKFPQ